MCKQKSKFGSNVGSRRLKTCTKSIVGPYFQGPMAYANLNLGWRVGGGRGIIAKFCNKQVFAL